MNVPALPARAELPGCGLVNPRSAASASGTNLTVGKRRRHRHGRFLFSAGRTPPAVPPRILAGNIAAKDFSMSSSGLRRQTDGGEEGDEFVLIGLRECRGRRRGDRRDRRGPLPRRDGFRCIRARFRGVADVWPKLSRQGPEGPFSNDPPARVAALDHDVCANEFPSWRATHERRDSPRSFDESNRPASRTHRD